MHYAIFDHDAYLLPYKADIELRMRRYEEKKKELLRAAPSLAEFANGHEYFGFHKVDGGWYYREWAPAADAVYLAGDMNGWDMTGLPLTRLENGVFEIFLAGDDTLYHGCHVKAVIRRGEDLFYRIPLYIHRVEQDPATREFCGVITCDVPYVWKKKRFAPQKELYIYECHVGMAQEHEGVGSYREFTERILPRIRENGYNTVQIMALMEHPYYGSFGYQVSNFFAASSRYGSINDLKALIDTAHGMGIAVLLDIVHSHAASNTAEGIAAFDGTPYQFFHAGARGDHPAWGTKLFNYDKNEVIHFLLSNLKYWLTEFHVDGFRFDGVTSMIYHDHGLGTAFTDYGKYFSMNTDVEAVTYLQLANALIREVDPHAITVAEDMSGMPGMCLPIAEGGIGFDYRLAMGLPDMWTRLTRDVRDEDWDMHYLYHELSSRRPHEKYIGYAESHDQALVGDKTLIFRLCDSAMYTDMRRGCDSAVIDRGIALHKIIRLLSLSLGGEGYLNFMGNEFGHPEWIDFPRAGNGWSHFYARRQWHLADDESLRYGEMLRFDRAMLTLAKEKKLFSHIPVCLMVDNERKIIVYARGGAVFLYNLHPTRSYADCEVPLPRAGRYRVALSSDDGAFGGFGRVAQDVVYDAVRRNDGVFSRIYLPTRTAVVLVRTTKT